MRPRPCGDAHCTASPDKRAIVSVTINDSKWRRGGALHPLYTTKRALRNLQSFHNPSANYWPVQATHTVVNYEEERVCCSMFGCISIRLVGSQTVCFDLKEVSGDILATLGWETSCKLNTDLILFKKVEWQTGLTSEANAEEPQTCRGRLHCSQKEVWLYESFWENHNEMKVAPILPVISGFYLGPSLNIRGESHDFIFTSHLDIKTSSESVKSDKKHSGGSVALKFKISFSTYTLNNLFKHPKLSY